MRVINASRRKTKPKKKKGKGQESMKGGEEKPHERENEEAGDEGKPDV